MSLMMPLLYVMTHKKCRTKSSPPDGDNLAGGEESACTEEQDDKIQKVM
jgi:hypothetical protein